MHIAIFKTADGMLDCPKTASRFIFVIGSPRRINKPTNMTTIFAIFLCLNGAFYANVLFVNDSYLPVACLEEKTVDGSS